MTPDELVDAELIMREFPTMTVAYIETDATDPEQPRFFSCLVDGKCAPDGNTGRRLPKYRVELPGHPILGDGKSDNQNHAIIFSRGSVIQVIDANQEGYLEESLKLPNALQEFRPKGTRQGPAVVGFREHIFSGLGALGEFVASSELVFGSLSQRVMADTLHSRYHYGHPDLLDKMAMVTQGGISKATRGLNLSEDVFAGMDAQLRGRSIVHRGYFQVGKGRHMGLLSNIEFFRKLSSGAAQMSTSRQAYRLGTRLGPARLFGFFYGHTGYYLGQLHVYHVGYALIALNFVGTVADGCHVFPGVAFASSKLLGAVYGALYIVFIMATFLPLSVSALLEDGLVQAVMLPLKHLRSAAPLFFAVQSKCIGHYLSYEFVSGGAAYAATERGLAIKHQRFHALYTTFAAPCFNPGLELLLMLTATALVITTTTSSSSLTSTSMVFALITPLTLLFAPLAFNPRAFELKMLASDAKAWLRWLGDTSPHGWLGYFEKLYYVPKLGSGPRFTGALLSKEVLMAPPLLLIVIESMRPRGWSVVHTLLLAVPIVPALFVLAHNFTIGRGRKSPALVPFLAVLVAVWLAIELAAFAVAYRGHLTASHWLALASARYFCWRATANGFVYLFACGGETIMAASATRTALGAVGHTVAALALIGDLIVGALVQAPLFVLALLPFATSAHFSCLFNITPSHVVGKSPPSAGPRGTRHAQSASTPAGKGMKVSSGTATK